ncbi:M56 family metallopeptidase [Microtetraspora niveoalba]|uniref:M56 family metallopeptidase n=1 Tax=Microtetraspora niveoalba TaxID=46175 RepID=UPI000A06D2AE|nr:M56 family metallopeptidase [Microtetraspora niveoalba]
MNFWLVAAGISLAPIMLGGRLAARLATAPWTHQSPRAALALWQAIGLAGGLGAIGIGLVAAVIPLAAVFPHGAHTLIGQIMDDRGLGGLDWTQISALAWSLGLAVWLLTHTIRTAVRTAATQRRQRLLVDLVADRCPSHDAYVLPDEGLAAYCVPGWRSRIVLSRGTLERLGPQELRAVIEHERAHAGGRHDLVLLPFIALHQAFPWIPAVRTAREVVPVLLEMMADDRASRAHGGLPLARALVQMASPAATTAGTPALAETAVVHRVERLLRGERPRSTWVPTAVYSAVSLLLSGPLAVLIAPLICIGIVQA